MPFAPSSSVARRFSRLRSTSRRHRLIAIGAICLLVFALIWETTSAQAAPATSPLPLSAIKDMNYMPSTASWDNMWTNWNPQQIATDYGTIAALGANTVRVAIPAPVFGYPYVNALQASHLATIFSLASAAGLHVQLTLFDEFGLYTQISSSISFVRALLAPYVNDPQIAFIELQNEINPSNASAMTWAAALIPAVQAEVGTIPVTISTAGALGPAGLAQLKSALAQTPPNFYDYHFYGSIGAAYSQLAQAQADAAPSPLFVGETGITTAGSNTALLESQQAEFFESVNSATAALNLPPAAPWTLIDLTQAGAPAGTSPADLDWGLYRVDGSAKPAAAVESNFFATGTEPTISNPSFETVANGTPTGWVQSNAGNGTFASDSTVDHTGSASVSISNTSGTQSAQPAWQTAADLGGVTAGQHVVATAWAQGSNATGTSTVSLAWFDGNNNYISNATSVTLPPGMSNWTQLGVDATAPANASYAVLSVQSYADSGTVWFDDASVTNLGTAAYPALPFVPATSGVGPVIANPSFETSSGGLPASWTKGNAANGTFALDSTVDHTGSQSVSISNTSGTQGAMPAWQTTANLGAITAGQQITASVWAQGSKATGTSTISVAWFTVANAYISNGTSATLPTGTTAWTQLQLTSTAPANASYAVVSVQSYQNTGTVWFDDVAMTNLASASAMKK